MNILLLIPRFITVWLRLLMPGGTRRIAAENIALRNQLITLTRNQKRAPKLTTFERITFGILAGFLSYKRLSRIAIALKPATMLKFHRALVKRKYRILFSNTSAKKPGRKGQDQSIINAIIEMKHRNPRYGCRRIAMQINLAFGTEIDKDIVRRVLNKHYKNLPNNNGPSWLTFLGHTKDSLWSVDFFRTESINLKSHWVMVVIDQFTRRIVGFAVHPGHITGIDACRMFNTIIAKKNFPKYLSSDNDPLFKFYRWQANLQIVDIEEIKTIPYAPLSHPFVERLIGSIRRELLDHTLFWTAADLETKLRSYQHYYNEKSGHLGIEGNTPLEKSRCAEQKLLNINDHRWKKHCRGLFQLPIAA